MKITSPLLDIIVPRLITEEVALDTDENGDWFVVCPKDDLREDDYYKCIGTCRAFDFFGLALFPKVRLPEGY